MVDRLGPASQNAVTVRPERTHPYGSIDTWFQPCSSPQAQDGTKLVADWFNDILGQLRAIITGGGITADNADAMLLYAVKALGRRYAAAGGGADALTAAFTPPVLAGQVVDGLKLAVKIAANNTGAATIDADELGAVPIKMPDGSALPADAMVAGMIALLDRTGATYQLSNPAVTPVAGGGGGGLPVGAVVMVLGDAPPANTLKGNGAELVRATYPDLWSYANASNRIVSEADWQNGANQMWTSFSSGDGATTFRLPDLRGEFPRFWDDGRGIDAARVLGVQQGDLVKNHAHSGVATLSGFLNNVLVFDNVADPFTGLWDVPAAGDAFTGNAEFVDQLTGNLSLAASGGGAETRPRNAALLPCIVYQVPA